MAYIGSTDFLLEVASGNVSGAEILILRGHNPDIDAASGFEDLWDAGGNLVRLTSAETMNISSSLASDTSAGVGLQTVLVKGVDGTGAEISEVISMNGTTDVLTVNTYYRVNFLISLTAGSTGYNVGVITATASIAGTVQCQMNADVGLSHNSQYTVPLGKSAYLFKVELNAARTSGGGSPIVDFRGYGIPFGGARLVLFEKFVDTGLSDELDIDITLPSKMTARTDFWMAADTDTNNTAVRSRMYLMIIED